MSLTEEILSQLPGDILGGLRRADTILTSLRDNNSPIPNVVKENPENLESLQFDVIICGGTLGILIGCALAVRGVRVALLERGILRGREQEWNISRQELKVFRELELLTEAELNQAIVTEYNPARVSFPGSTEVWVEDVLNIGISPIY
ncbi:MAG: FAD-binding oxidoreductase, partial [Dolichospermum sp.]